MKARQVAMGTALAVLFWSATVSAESEVLLDADAAAGPVEAGALIAQWQDRLQELAEALEYEQQELRTAGHAVDVAYAATGVLLVQAKTVKELALQLRHLGARIDEGLALARNVSAGWAPEKVSEWAPMLGVYRNLLSVCAEGREDKLGYAVAVALIDQQEKRLVTEVKRMSGRQLLAARLKERHAELQQMKGLLRQRIEHIRRQATES